MDANDNTLWSRRPWRHAPAECVDAPPGMLGNGEGHLLYYLARDHYRGSGAIVDAGAFLGRSAWFLARGLEANPNVPRTATPRIHSFDLFIVNDEPTRRHIEAQLAVTLPYKASMRHLFDAATQPIAHLLQVHEGDFREAVWRDPIEILFVDVAKMPSLHQHMVEEFFPHLVPGHSIVVQQDYHHAHLPYIHAAMEYLRDYFELVEPKIDDSAVFLNTRPIPPELLRYAARIHEAPFAERLALMDAAIARLPAGTRRYVQLARATMLGNAGDVDAMAETLASGDAEATAVGRDDYWAAAHTEIAFTLSWLQIGQGRADEVLRQLDALPEWARYHPEAVLLADYARRQQTRRAQPGFPHPTGLADAAERLRHLLDPQLAAVDATNAVNIAMALVAAHFRPSERAGAPSAGPLVHTSSATFDAELLAFELFHRAFEAPEAQVTLAGLRARLDLVRSALRSERGPEFAAFFGGIPLARTHAYLATASDEQFAPVVAWLTS